MSESEVHSCIRRCVETTLVLQRTLSQQQGQQSDSSKATTSSSDILQMGVLSTINSNARHVLADATLLLQRVITPATASSLPSSSPSTAPVVPMVLYLELHGARRELLDMLRRSMEEEESQTERSKRLTQPTLLTQQQSETPDTGSGTGAAGGEELRSLLRTRAMLAAESDKMNNVLANIQEGSEALNALHQSLEGVHSTLSRTDRLVGALVRVKKVEDVVLRVSWLCFALTVCWVLAQRLFAIGGPTVVYQ